MAAPGRRPPGFFGGESRHESSQTHVPVSRFLGPRYWRAWVLIGWLKLAACLPWRWSLALHKRLGRWLGARSSKSTGLVRSNLRQCFPDLDEGRIAALTAEYHENMGAIVAELALAWFGSHERLLDLFEFHGTGNLARALERGNGVILCTGHFTPVELCTVMVKQHAPHYALMYNPRRNRLLSEYQRRCREKYADESFSKRNLRAMLRSLQRNAVVWYAADEAHTGKSSAVLPFFGVPALTNTALSRLARISGAAVIPMAYRRKDDDSGYVIRFDPPLDDYPTDDDIADAQRTVALLESAIRDCPAQYFWKQRRFRGRRGEAERPASGHRSRRPEASGDRATEEGKT